MDDSISLVAASAAIRRGDLTPLELVADCCTRINRFDSQVHAWVALDASGAFQAAERLTRELADGRWRGRLHGIPVGIKDLVDVAGFPTRAGSSLTDPAPVRHDATIVARLRSAGAIILGKTVTTEFACFDPSPTRNPWNPAHTPGGSSSGSAAALALSMCFGAIGSQTGGSITRPASYCGVAGCKPTFGRVSRAGVMPVSFHLDHVGPMARTAADCAVLLSAIAGDDPEDPSAFPGNDRELDGLSERLPLPLGEGWGEGESEAQGDPHPTLSQRERGLKQSLDDSAATAPRPGATAGLSSSAAALGATAGLSSSAAAPPRLGVIEPFFFDTADSEVAGLTRIALDVLRRQGATLVDLPLPAGFEQVHAMHRRLMAAEAADFHRSRFGAPRDGYGPNMAALLDEGFAISMSDYQSALRHQALFRNALARTLAGIDALVTPSTPTAAPASLASTGDPRFNSPWSYTGVPTVSIPCALTSAGLPISLQFVAPAWSEAKLLAIAIWAEQRLEFRGVPPMFAA